MFRPKLFRNPSSNLACCESKYMTISYAKLLSNYDNWAYSLLSLS
jgi:hypothetical protein